MARFLAVGPLLFVVSIFTFAQTPIVSNLQAVTLATNSLAALNGGNPVSDVTLTGNATWIAGSDQESGSAMLYAKTAEESLVTLNLSGGIRSELRTNVTGLPQGELKSPNATAVSSFAQHDAWTDAVWFFPALSSLTHISSPNYLFSYVGQEQRNGLTVEHLRVSQTFASDTGNILRVAQMSATDLYLDSTSHLPLFVNFNTHPDNNMNVNIPVEIRFADYRIVNGVQIPFHVQKLLNYSLALDIIVNNAVVNSGLSDTLFTLQ